jgi:DNA (cytosine-5)-methyltransferase 1
MLKVLELFAGIGACSKALTNLGIEHEIVDAVEIDKYAVKSFNAIHGTNFEPQDITKWDKDIECDLIMHGSPCQDFSVAGLGKGGDKGSGTRSSLMYETLRIVEKLKPKYVIWENVKNLLSKKHRHNFDAYIEAMEKLGYKSKYQVLNAKDYGVPQNRERVFTVSILGENNFSFPEPIKLEKSLKDVLESQVEDKYYLSDEQVESFKASTEKAQAKGNGFKFEPLERERESNCSRNLHESREQADGQLYSRAIRLGGIYDKPGRKHQAGSIYEKRGIAPTLSTMQGGNLEPMIVASRGRGENNTQTLEARKDGLTNTITSVQKDNYVMCSDKNSE